MDPTAPDSDQDEQNNQAGPSPIQPGQFVVTSQETLQNPNPLQSAPQPDANSFAPIAEPQAPAGFTANSYQVAQTQGPMMPPAPPQPDPTPFTPPVAPSQAPPPADSKFSLIKIIGIAAGVISLLVIIAALVWFFLLNKKSSQPATTSGEQVIEEPSPPAQPSGGFSQIPESTAQASPSGSPAASGQTPLPTATTNP